jgi:hypothetical protein
VPAVNGFVVCAVGAAYMVTAVVSVANFYGDHASKVALHLPKAPTTCAALNTAAG